MSLIGRSSSMLDLIAEKLERSTWLDKPGEALNTALQKALPDALSRNYLTGTVIGHPLHPAVVAVPIGSWVAASYLDFVPGQQRAARSLVALGIVSAVPAAASGASDWLTTSGAERRVGVAHAALNTAALVLYTGSWIARGRGDNVRGRALSLAGLAIASASGWLGGHLAYALGVGVDTTTFQSLPEDWVDVIDAGELVRDRPTRVDVEGVPVLLVATVDGYHAMADRCSHRGGPLHEGELNDGCIVCPWHGSEFRLADGGVENGPATRPQTTLEVRVENGRLQVRRPDEERELRVNPVGV